jgi:hypothetical protein
MDVTNWLEAISSGRWLICSSEDASQHKKCRNRDFII